MLAGCPVCRSIYRIDAARIGMEGLKLRCGSCRTIFRISGKGRKNPEAARRTDQPKALVLVAHESPNFCSSIVKLLAPEPFDLITFTNGQEAFNAVSALKPDVLVLDVALPGMYGFEICEQVKRDPSTADIKIILVASIYDKTKYKRSPQSLYGADDHIEKHHIPDELAAKIYRLIAGVAPADASPGKAANAEKLAVTVAQQATMTEEAEQEAAREELRLDEEFATRAVADLSPEQAEAHRKAKRLARIIASDIALYSQAAVEEGVRTGTFFEVMASDVAEGRTYYAGRVASEIRESTAYLDEAFEDLIAKIRKELNV